MGEFLFPKNRKTYIIYLRWSLFYVGDNETMTIMKQRKWSPTRKRIYSNLVENICWETTITMLEYKCWLSIGTYPRSSYRRCSVKKGVLRNFAKFTGKHLCQSLLFNKVAGLRPKACNFIKKEILEQVLSCEFCEISKNTFFYRTPPDDCFW